MAIRIREIDGETVALCAAKTRRKKTDKYIDDAAHHALTTKFLVDFESEGLLLPDPPVDDIVKKIMLAEERKRL